MLKSCSAFSASSTAKYGERESVRETGREGGREGEKESEKESEKEREREREREREKEREYSMHIYSIYIRHHPQEADSTVASQCSVVLTHIGLL